MISLRFCIEEGCTGTLRAVQAGGYHHDTKVSKLKCNKCGQLACAVQFLAPIEVMKYARIEDSTGRRIGTMPRLRHPITVDLDPHLAPEVRVHNCLPNPW